VPKGCNSGVALFGARLHCVPLLWTIGYACHMRCGVCVTTSGSGEPDIEYCCWLHHGTAMLRVGGLGQRVFEDESRPRNPRDI
jgi:hypothetical protein